MSTLTPVRPTIPHISAPFAPEKLGKSQSNAAAARGRSTPPAPGFLGPLSGPCFPRVTWVVLTVTPQPPTVTPLWHSSPHIIVPMQTVPPPLGFKNCLPSARALGPLSLPPTFVQDYPLSTQNLPPISSQTDQSNPPPPAPTNPTFSPPSPNHPNFVCILQWNSGGLSSFLRAELCPFLSSSRKNLVLLQETNLSSSRNFKVPGHSVFRADRTLTRRGPATAGNQNGGGVLTLINSYPSFQMASLFISPSLTRPQTISVSKSISRSDTLFSSSMSTPLPSETLNSILDLTPSPLNFSRTPLTPLFSAISMSITPRGTHTHLSRQCWQFPIQLDLILPARYPQQP